MSQQELKPTQKPATEATATRLVSAFFVAAVPGFNSALSVSCGPNIQASNRIDSISPAWLGAVDVQTFVTGQGQPHGLLLVKGKQRIFVPMSNVTGLVYE